MSEPSSNPPLTTADLVRFAQQHQELVDRARLLGARANLREAAVTARVSYNWAKRFVRNEIPGIDVTRLCRLYLALLGETQN